MPAPFLLLLSLVACHDATAPASAPPPAAARQEIQWEHIRTWSGSGSQYLDSFPSEGSLRIEWESTREAGANTPGRLTITLHSAISGRPLAAPVVDHSGDGKGIAYFSEEPRVFFASVTAEEVEWKISISERVR